MDRDELIELISAHLDGELDAEEQSRLEKALEESEEARSLMQSYRSQGEALRALPVLETPEHLESEVQEKIAKEPIPLSNARPKKSNTWLWIMGSVAACFLFFIGAEFNQPVSSNQRLFMSAEGLVSAPLIHPEQMELIPQEGNRVALVSNQFLGKFSDGEATLSWDADAGTLSGTRVKAILSIDFDGDSQYDLVEESELLPLDEEDGFEKLRATFPVKVPPGVQGPYQARVELVAEQAESHGIMVKFSPDSSSLELPLKEFHSV